MSFTGTTFNQPVIRRLSDGFNRGRQLKTGAGFCRSQIVRANESTRLCDLKSNRRLIATTTNEDDQISSSAESSAGDKTNTATSPPCDSTNQPTCGTNNDKCESFEETTTSPDTEVKASMMTRNLSSILAKAGYGLVGNHSAVKVCRWTKNQLRGH